MSYGHERYASFTLPIRGAVQSCPPKIAKETKGVWCSLSPKLKSPIRNSREIGGAFHGVNSDRVASDSSWDHLVHCQTSVAVCPDFVFRSILCHVNHQHWRWRLRSRLFSVSFLWVSIASARIRWCRISHEDPYFACYSASS